MKVEVGTLMKLLETLSLKTGRSLDHAGLNEISEMIPGMKTEYLYKKILQQIRGKQDNEQCGIGSFQLNQILSFLGFKSLASFEEHINHPVNDKLISLTGNYYCYVRANHLLGAVLRSPVRIYADDANVFFELKGKDYAYKGDIYERDGCLFILMISAEGKRFHHVYKIGTRKFPKVLQGVFSGVSTAFDPIGGRVVLIKQEAAFDQLSNRKEKIDAMLDSGVQEEVAIATYFKEYYNNNISPRKSVDFGYDDLQ